MNTTVPRAITCVGVDAGGTKIEVSLTNAKGEVFSTLRTELSANPTNIGMTKTINNLVLAIKQNFDFASAPMQTMASVVVGLAGVDDEIFRREAENHLSNSLATLTNSTLQVEVLTDSEVALLSVNKGAGSMVIIAGTGAVVKGKNKNGKIERADGWGNLFGDEGSATWIGRAALKVIFAAHDGRRGEADKLTKAILNHVGVSHLEKLIPYFYADGETSNTRIAEIAKVVYNVAKTGNPVARKILKKAGLKLSNSAIAVIRKLELTEEIFSIALVGSVFQAKEFIVEPLMNEIIKFAKNAVFVETEFSPSVVASFRALENARCPYLTP